MIAKKEGEFGTPRMTEARIQRKSMMFFNVGLFTMSSIVLAAFTYESPVELRRTARLINAEPVMYTLEEQPEKEIPRMNDTPVQQQEQQTETTVDISSEVDENLRVVGNTTNEVNPDVTLGGLTVRSDIDINIGGLVEIDNNDIIDIPTIDAGFVGGYAALQKYISENLIYPDEAITFGEQGIAYVNFVVEKDGSISNVTIERGVSKSIDREAKRIVRGFPKWTPGEAKEGVVRTRVILPIKFTLD